MEVKLKNSDKLVTIDDEDWTRLSNKGNLYLNKRGYVQFNWFNRTVMLHRYILNYKGGDVVDHINHNPLDNRKINLRVLSASDNSVIRNSKKESTSRFKGVRFLARRNKWKVEFMVNGEQKFFGYFNTEVEAAIKSQAMFDRYRPELCINVDTTKNTQVCV